MDTAVQRLLNDKLYDKRKVGALESVPRPHDRCPILLRPTDHSPRLERVIRELVATKDYDKVTAILDQLCNEYAYAVHQPHARNGGLIGLAAAAIALGPVRSLFSCAHSMLGVTSDAVSVLGTAALPRSHRPPCACLLYRSGCTS